MCVAGCGWMGGGGGGRGINTFLFKEAEGGVKCLACCVISDDLLKYFSFKSLSFCFLQKIGFSILWANSAENMM